MLGGIQGFVSRGDYSVRIEVAVAAQGYPNARGGAHIMALYNDCGREFIEYAIGDCGCQRAIDRAQQKDRKFVTANSAMVSPSRVALRNAFATWRRSASPTA